MLVKLLQGILDRLWLGRTVFYVSIDQTGAGTTDIASASSGQRCKIVSAFLIIAAVGTCKFIDESGDLTGALPLDANGGFVLPASLVPYAVGSVNSKVSVVTTGGAVKGCIGYILEA